MRLQIKFANLKINIIIILCRDIIKINYLSKLYTKEVTVMEKEIDVAYVLSALGTVNNVNDRSVFSIKTHLVLINKMFKSK